MPTYHLLKNSGGLAGSYKMADGIHLRSEMVDIKMSAGHRSAGVSVMEVFISLLALGCGHSQHLQAAVAFLGSVSPTLKPATIG